MARIATITSGLSDGTGGTDRHLASLRAFLIGEGHEVDEYHFEQLNPPRPWTLLDRLGFRHPHHGRELIRRALGRLPPYALYFANGYLGAYLPPGYPVVNVLHSCDAAYADTIRSQISWAEYFRQRVVWAWFERQSARRHYTVSVSRALEKDFLRYYRIRPNEVIPLCIDREIFKPGDREAARKKLDLPNGLPVVLFAGTWCYRKGADLVTQVSQRLEGKVRVVAACQKGGDLSRPSTVQFLGEFSAAEMPTVFQAADIFLFPSRAESFGYVTAEAMSCALPILTTAVGIGQDLAIEPKLAPYIMQGSGSVEGLCKVILDLSGDADSRRNLGQAALQYATQHFSKSIFAQRYRKLLSRFLP